MKKILLFTVMLISIGIVFAMANPDIQQQDGQKEESPSWLIEKSDMLSGTIPFELAESKGDGTVMGKNITEIKMLDPDIRKQTRKYKNINGDSERIEGTDVNVETTGIASVLSGSKYMTMLGYYSLDEKQSSIAINRANSNKVMSTFQMEDWYYPYNKCVARISSNYGTSWSGYYYLPMYYSSDYCYSPVAAWSSDGMTGYAGYRSGSYRAVLSRYVSGIWTSPTIIFDGNNLGGYLDSLWITADKDSSRPDDVYAVATLFKSGECSIIYSRSEDRGGTWSSPIKLDSAQCGYYKDSDRVIQGPSVAADNGNVAVSWYDSTSDGSLNGIFAINVKRSTDGGNTFISYDTIKPNEQFTELPYYLGPGDGLHRIWTSMFPRIDVRNVNGNTNVALIFSARKEAGSLDSADLWIAYATNLGPFTVRRVDGGGNGLYASYFGDVAIDESGNKHILWMDSRNALERYSGSSQQQRSYGNRYGYGWYDSDSYSYNEYDQYEEDYNYPILNQLYRIYYRNMSSNGILGSETIMTKYNAAHEYFIGDHNDADTLGNNLYFIYTDRLDAGSDVRGVYKYESDVSLIKLGLTP